MLGTNIRYRGQVGNSHDRKKNPSWAFPTCPLYQTEYLVPNTVV